MKNEMNDVHHLLHCEVMDNFSVQNEQSSQEIPNCNNFKLIMTNFRNFNGNWCIRYLQGYLNYFQNIVAKLWATEHQSCQEPETLSIVYFFPNKLLDLYKMS